MFLFPGICEEIFCVVLLYELQYFSYNCVPVLVFEDLCLLDFENSLMARFVVWSRIRHFITVMVSRVFLCCEFSFCSTVLFVNLMSPLHEGGSPSIIWCVYISSSLEEAQYRESDNYTSLSCQGIKRSFCDVGVLLKISLPVSL